MTESATAPASCRAAARFIKSSSSRRWSFVAHASTRRERRSYQMTGTVLDSLIVCKFLRKCFTDFYGEAADLLTDPGTELTQEGILLHLSAQGQKGDNIARRQPGKGKGALPRRPLFRRCGCRSLDLEPNGGSVERERRRKRDCRVRAGGLGG